MKNIQPAYIYGAGSGGSKVLNYYLDRYEIKGFIDSDMEKHGAKLRGFTIYPPTQLVDDLSMVIIASEFAEQIQDFLLHTMNIAAHRILITPTEYMKGTPFSVPANLKLANLQLSLLHKLLKKNAIRYHLEAGTLLGLVRDAKLIPWDTDVDLAFDATQLEELRKLLPEFIHELQQLSGIDYEQTELFSSYNYGPIKSGMLRSIQISPRTGNGPGLDLFAKYKKGKHIYWSLASRGMRAPLNSLMQLDSLTYIDLIFPVPANTSSYLKNMYGTWQTPNKEWTLNQCQNTSIYGVNS